MTVTDDDTAAIVLSEMDLTVTEGDAAGSSYTVRLATQPSAASRSPSQDTTART